MLISKRASLFAIIIISFHFDGFSNIFFLLNYKTFVLSQQIVRDELKIAAIGLESQKCVTKMPMFRLDKTFFFSTKSTFCIFTSLNRPKRDHFTVL